MDPNDNGIYKISIFFFPNIHYLEKHDGQFNQFLKQVDKRRSLRYPIWFIIRLGINREWILI